MKNLVVLALLVLVSQAVIRDDLMNKVPVNVMSFRAMAMTGRELCIRAISTLPTPPEDSTTYSLSPSKDLIIKTQ